MKKFIVMAMSMLVVLMANAQLRTPAPSPYSQVVQNVGLTDITVEYSRPSMKDRAIFGDLVPMGEAWRTGANQATKFTFSTDVNIGGAELAAGSYALITKPMATAWELHFYPYTSSNWSSYLNGDAEAIVGKTNQIVEMPFAVESFMIVFDNLRNGSASLHLVWENTNASAEVTVPTDEAVEKMIASTMAGPTAGEYRAAAGYYLEEGKDMEQALEWINKSLEMGGERFWILRQKALIQAELGQYAEAIKTAARSTELAKESGNADYPRMNEKSIAIWSDKG